MDAPDRQEAPWETRLAVVNEPRYPMPDRGNCALIGRKMPTNTAKNALLLNTTVAQEREARLSLYPPWYI